jgi:hypothetical protein
MPTDSRGMRTEILDPVKRKMDGGRIFYLEDGPLNLAHAMGSRGYRKPGLVAFSPLPPPIGQRILSAWPRVRLDPYTRIHGPCHTQLYSIVIATR